MADFLSDQNITFIDVEIPNINNDCICAISMIVVQKGKEILRHTELLDPQTFFSPQNISIHKIRRQDVTGKRTLAQFWEEYHQYFSHDYIIAAHNAMSDVSVLKKDLSRIHQSLEAHLYLDTMDICSSFLKNISLKKGDLKLDGLAKRFEIELEHHNPASDVNACYQITKLLCEKEEINLQDFVRPIRYKVKEKVEMSPSLSKRKMAKYVRLIRKRLKRHDQCLDLPMNTVIAQGDRSYSKGNYELAIHWYETAIWKKCLVPRVYRSLAEIYGEAHLYHEAFFILDLGILRLKNSTGAYESLVRLEKRLKMQQKIYQEKSKKDKKSPLSKFKK